MQQFAQGDFHFAAVRQLDADGVLAGNGSEDVDSFGARGAGEVALQTDDLVHPHAFGGINFVAGDGGTFCDVARRNRDAELGERFDERLLDVFEFGGIGRHPPFAVMLIEEIDARQLIIFALPVC